MKMEQNGLRLEAGEGEWDPEVQSLGIPGEKSSLAPKDKQVLKMSFRVDHMSEMNLIINQMEEQIKKYVDPNFDFVGKSHLIQMIPKKL